MITGQIVFREVSQGDCDKVGKHIMMFCGIIAIPKGVLQGEHKYDIGGYSDVLDNVVRMEINPSSLEPLTELKHLASPLGSLLLEPIWHV